MSTLGTGAVFLAACGSDDGSVGASDSTEIETLLERHYSAPSCDDLTGSGRTEFGHPVEDAACADDIASQAPKEVTVSDVMVDGDTATAVADRFTFALVKVDGTWLIDGGA